MASLPFIIRTAVVSEYKSISKLLVDVYSSLDGFPKPAEQPAYYALLERVGDFTSQPGTTIMVAVKDAEILGAVVYFNEMKYYGSGGIATQIQNAAGFRLLGVKPTARGLGVGKALTLACINKACENKRDEIIIHTTTPMQQAWKMYEHIGFRRSVELDFSQGTLKVFGLRYKL